MSKLRHHLDIKDKEINNLQQTINRLKGQLSSRDSWREIKFCHDGPEDHWRIENVN